MGFLGNVAAGVVTSALVGANPAHAKDSNPVTGADSKPTLEQASIAAQQGPSLQLNFKSGGAPVAAQVIDYASKIENAIDKENLKVKTSAAVVELPRVLRDLTEAGFSAEQSRIIALKLVGLGGYIKFVESESIHRGSESSSPRDELSEVVSGMRKKDAEEMAALGQYRKEIYDIVESTLKGSPLIQLIELFKRNPLFVPGDYKDLVAQNVRTITQQIKPQIELEISKAFVKAAASNVNEKELSTAISGLPEWQKAAATKGVSTAKVISDSLGSVFLKDVAVLAASADSKGHFNDPTGVAREVLTRLQNPGAGVLPFSDALVLAAVNYFSSPGSAEQKAFESEAAKYKLEAHAFAAKYNMEQLAKEEAAKQAELAAAAAKIEEAKKAAELAAKAQTGQVGGQKQKQFGGTNDVAKTFSAVGAVANAAGYQNVAGAAGVAAILSNGPQGDRDVQLARLKTLGVSESKAGEIVSAAEEFNK